jgi:hypothetical protein
MFGHKLSKRNLINGFHKAKNFVGHAYNTSKNILSNVDNGVKLFKHVYSTIHPLIDKYGGENLNQGIMKTLNTYDNIKSHAMNAHNEIDSNVNNLKNTLVKKKHNFNFA